MRPAAGEESVARSRERGGGDRRGGSWLDLLITPEHAGGRLGRLAGNHIDLAAPGVERFRQRMSFSILLTVAVLILVAYVPSVVACVVAGFWDVLILDTVLMVWLVALLLVPALTFELRVTGLVVTVFGLGFYLLVRIGLTGGGVLWLFAGPLLLALLRGVRAGLAGVGVNAVFLLVVGLVGHWVSLPWQLQVTPFGLVWTVICANFLVLNLLVTLAVGGLLGGLESTLSDLEARLRELSLTQEATIECMAGLAEFRDPDAAAHIRRTRAYVRVLAARLAEKPAHAARLDAARIELLCRSVPLHDIGKVGVPDRVLFKAGTLSAEEYEEMKLHTLYGRDALQRAESKLGENSFLHQAMEVAYGHQERWDGSGYPQGLRGEAIPLSARIMAVADVYDALTSARVYKTAQSHEDAVAEIARHSGRHFDPAVVEAFLEREARFRQIATELGPERIEPSGDGAVAVG